MSTKSCVGINKIKVSRSQVKDVNLVLPIPENNISCHGIAILWIKKNLL